MHFECVTVVGGIARNKQAVGLPLPGHVAFGVVQLVQVVNVCQVDSADNFLLRLVTGSSSSFGLNMIEHALRQGDCVATLRRPEVLSEPSPKFPPG